MVVVAPPAPRWAAGAPLEVEAAVGPPGHLGQEMVSEDKPLTIEAGVSRYEPAGLRSLGSFALKILSDFITPQTPIFNALKEGLLDIYPKLADPPFPFENDLEIALLVAAFLRAGEPEKASILLRQNRLADHDLYKGIAGYALDAALEADRQMRWDDAIGICTV